MFLLTNRYAQIATLIVVILFGLNWWKNGAVVDAVNAVYVEIENQVNELIKEDKENVEDINNNLPGDVFDGLQPKASSEDRQIRNEGDSKEKAHLFPKAGYSDGNEEIGTIWSGERLPNSSIFRESDTSALQEEIKCDPDELMHLKTLNTNSNYSCRKEWIWVLTHD